jgi:cation diffusion facilitator CzcD-associated flavoprotein CzcO
MSDNEGAGRAVQPDVDVLIIGAGITGVYQLYTLREAGFNARIVEAAPGAGGTWYWNRYPEARFDSESYSYGYFFSRELFDEWKWSERFAGQPEIEQYINHAIDRFGLRDSITFDYRVESLQFDAEDDFWLVHPQEGPELKARYIVTAVGLLSAPYLPSISGQERFRGKQYHTGLWPERGVMFEGRRVAVVGTGSSGIQIVPAIADKVEQLVVFQRTANWATPLHNSPISSDEHEEIVADFDGLRETLLQTYSGFIHRDPTKNTFDDSPTDRLAHYEQLWSTPGLCKAYSNYADLATNPEANREFCKFIEAKIRAIVKDPETADKLIPKDHGYAMKRPPMENGFYEAFNRDNVTLVDLKATPLTEVTETGLKTTAGEYDFDIIVWATGFDAVTGSITRMDIRSGDTTLNDTWNEGPRTYLGLGVAGFPNLFIVGGPATYGNAPRSTEDQVDFVTNIIRHASNQSHTRVEVTDEAEEIWTKHCDELASHIMVAETAWFTGANIPGKPNRFLVYLGGLPTYRDKTRSVASDGYEGFAFDATT